MGLVQDLGKPPIKKNYVITMNDDEYISIMMLLEKEAGIINSVFPNANIRVMFNATYSTLLDEDGDTDSGYYKTGNIVMSTTEYCPTMTYHEFGHYLASLFSKEEFKPLALQCYKEMRTTPYNKALKLYKKEKRPEEAFCLYFQLTMNDPKKRNNAFIQKLKARYEAVKETDEYRKEMCEYFDECRDIFGGKVITMTGRVFHHVDEKTYNGILDAWRANPISAPIADINEKINRRL